jgi:hypothetical protein
MPDGRARVRKEGLNSVDPLHRVNPWFGLGVEALGQSVDLLDIENRVALHERNLAFGLLAGDGVGLGTDDLVGINNEAAVFALADVGFQLACLLEGHPDRRGVTFLHRRRPQHQNIDAVIGNSVPAQRPRDTARRMLGVPRLEPRPDAFLKLANDLIGDALIDIRFHCLFLPGFA